MVGLRLNIASILSVTKKPPTTLKSANPRDMDPIIKIANKYLAKRLPNKDSIKIYEKLTKNFPKNNNYFYLSAKRTLEVGDISGSLEDLE